MFFSSDRGGEFLSVKLQQYLKREQILHQLAPARTPQYNAISERANRTIGEMSQALRIYANLPYSYWGYARKYVASKLHLK
jgi:transposase InsO family protein